MTLRTGADAYYPSAATVGVCVLLLTVAVGAPLAQDWLPFHLAAILAPSGDWDALYPSGAVTSLFDAPREYRELAQATITAHGMPGFKLEMLTAFISPPPAAFLLLPLRSLPMTSAMVLSRLALAVPLCVALLLFSSCAGSLKLNVLRDWPFLYVLGAPLLVYSIAIGQPSAWAATACVLSVLPSTAKRDVAGGIALALLVLTKATPACVALGLWMVGRQRLAVVAAGVTAGAVLASLPAAGLTAWQAFLGVSTQLARGVITDWNNLALDAMVLRSVTLVADSALRQPEGISLAVSWSGRVAILLAAVWSASRAGAPMARKVGAVWIAWLAATPLLWLHYAATLIPLLGFAPSHRRVPAFALAAFLSAVVAVRICGAGSLWVGNLGGLAWLASAGWLLSDCAWAGGPAGSSQAVQTPVCVQSSGAAR